MGSKLPIPFFFAIHTWIVIEDEDGKKERWEVFQRKNNKDMGYVYKNLFNPKEGMNINPWRKHPKWKSKEIFSVKEKNAKEYPHKNKYVLWPGPNSNTFTQWVLNQFSEIKNKLPWNAFGKNYKGT